MLRHHQSIPFEDTRLLGVQNEDEWLDRTTKATLVTIDLASSHLCHDSRIGCRESLVNSESNG